jgi:serine-type D-Ala-D-Ala carboxypeptidase/endopeptidase
MVSSGGSASPTLSADIATAIERAVERQAVRAAVVGLYNNGTVSVIGFGQMGRNDERPPDGGTAFEIGSISKVFTALLAQVLVDRDVLDWDEPISKYLPDTEFRSSAVADVTLRELASHTSGLPRVPDNMKTEDPLDPYAGYERDDLLSFIAALPGDRLEKSYDYSNLGAGLLGLIAGDVAGSGYAEGVQRHVLQPLGMRDSSSGSHDAHGERLAQGFSQGADMPNWVGFDAMAGAGAIVSTTDDLLHFIERNFVDGPAAKSLAAIREPQAAGDTALGWHIHSIADDDRVFWHNGGTGGYASYLALRPATRTGVVILTASTEYGLVTELGFAQISERPLQTGDVDLQPYPGAYQLAEGFILTVFIEEGRLFGQATGQGPFAMAPAGENEFVYPAAGIRIAFDRDTAGAAGSLTFFQGEQVTKAPRVADDQGMQIRTAIELQPDVLEDYVGRYQLAPGAIITIEARDRQLFAQLTGQAAFPVFAWEPDRFFLKVVDAQLHFERDDEGRVVAVVLHQMGQQRAPRID